VSELTGGPTGLDTTHWAHWRCAITCMKNSFIFFCLSNIKSSKKGVAGNPKLGTVLYSIIVTILALFFIFCLLHPFILHSQSLVYHSFPHMLLGPPPNHLTSHLMDHLTIPQSSITCHHSAVRSTLLSFCSITIYPFTDCHLMMYYL